MFGFRVAFDGYPPPPCYFKQNIHNIGVKLGPRFWRTARGVGLAAFWRGSGCQVLGLHADVLLADVAEDGEEIGHDEEVADGGAEVAELEGASPGFGGGVETDERAEAHGVHLGEVAEVEDDVLVGGDEVRDRGVEEVGVAVDEAAVAVDDGGGTVVFDGDG
jgi:hypothetical protein